MVCTPDGCATTEAVAACEQLADDVACVVDSIEGTCIGRACREPECGDGRIDLLYEACDDENTVDGDGCSETCNSNETCGNETIDTRFGEECDVGLAGLSADGCTSTCKREEPGWRDVSPQVIGARAGVSMAMRTGGQLIAFGGYTEGAYLDETWTFEYETWTRIDPATSPSARTWASMAYDESHEQLILFSGYLADNATWTWDGTTWTKLAPTTSPPARYHAAMAYDPNAGGLLLYGGIGRNATGLWNGTT